MSYSEGFIAWVHIACNEFSVSLAWLDSFSVVCALCIAFCSFCSSKRCHYLRSIASFVSQCIDRQRQRHLADGRSAWPCAATEKRQHAEDGDRSPLVSLFLLLLSNRMLKRLGQPARAASDRPALPVRKPTLPDPAGNSASTRALARCQCCEDPAEIIRRGIAPRESKRREGTTPQFAAVVFNGQPPDKEKVKSERKRIFSGSEPTSMVRERLGSTLIEPGSMIVARLPKKASIADPISFTAHAEALLVERLEREPPSSFIGLSPICFYSSLCPCDSCAHRIAAFAASLPPEVNVQLAYNYVWVPDKFAKFRGGISDASSVAVLKDAGIKVRKLRDD